MDISAEVRLWWPGSYSDRLASWFAELSDIAPGGATSPRSSGATAAIRKDIYLNDPEQPDLGVKIRSADGPETRVELKSLIDVREDEPPFGPVTIWVKASPRGLRLDPSRTIATSKLRRVRRFGWDGASLNEIGLDAGENVLVGDEPESGCNLELTRVEIQGLEDFWCTVGFEAFGSLSIVEPVLRLCVQHTARAALPPAIKNAEAGSYPALLARFVRERSS